MFKVDTTDSSDLYLSDEVNLVDDTELYYMQNSLQNIKESNIKEFNYIVFEEDLDNMYKSEFEEFFKMKLVPLIENFDDLNISLDELHNEPYRVKQAFAKNIIRFIMNTLPYIYMKEFMESKEVEGLHDALDLLNDDLNDNIIAQINVSKSQYNNFSSMMINIEDTITNDKKRDKFTGMLSLLDASMDNKSKLLDYYISIIVNSGNDGLRNLCTKYLKNDLNNLI